VSNKTTDAAMKAAKSFEAIWIRYAIPILKDLGFAPLRSGLLPERFAVWQRHSPNLNLQASLDWKSQNLYFHVSPVGIPPSWGIEVADLVKLLTTKIEIKSITKFDTVLDNLLWKLEVIKGPLAELFSENPSLEKITWNNQINSVFNQNWKEFDTYPWSVSLCSGIDPHIFMNESDRYVTELLGSFGFKKGPVIVSPGMVFEISYYSPKVLARLYYELRDCFCDIAFVCPGFSVSAGVGAYELARKLGDAGDLPSRFPVGSISEELRKVRKCLETHLGGVLEGVVSIESICEERQNTVSKIVASALGSKKDTSAGGQS